MLITLFKIIGKGLRCATAEVSSATAANHHYRRPPLSTSEKAYCWLIGLCEGLAQGMRDSRNKNLRIAHFDSSAFPQVSFSVPASAPEIMLVEVTRPDGFGVPMDVCSTLSFLEAQAVRKGIQILRDTGVFSLTDRETHELLRCTGSMTLPASLNDRSDPRVTYADTTN